MAHLKPALAQPMEMCHPELVRHRRTREGPYDAIGLARKNDGTSLTHVRTESPVLMTLDLKPSRPRDLYH